MVKPHSARDEHEGLVVLLHLLGTLADIKHLYYPPSLPPSLLGGGHLRPASGSPVAGRGRGIRAAGNVLECRGIDKQV